MLAVGQFLLLVQVLHLPWELSLLDALISHLWVAALGISIWYVLAYHVFKHSFYTALLHHIVLIFLFAFGWSGSLLTIFATLYSDDPQTLQTLQSLHPWRLAIGGLYYILLVLVYSLFRSMTSLRERIESEVRLREMLQRSELNLLKSQLNPHFLFNSLNSLSALISFAPEKAEKMVSSLAEYLRYSIAAPAHSCIPLEDELKNNRLFLSIEQIRFADKLQLQESIDPATLHVKVPAMILQPLYENAIKHGVSESISPTVLSTTIQLQNEYLTIEISNTLERPSTRKGTGLGLRNVRERLRLLYGAQKSRVQQTATPTHFSVQLFLPKDPSIR